MIQIGSIHILSDREFSKYEKLHKIFRVYSTQELWEVLGWLNEKQAIPRRYDNAKRH